MHVVRTPFSLYVVIVSPARGTYAQQTGSTGADYDTMARPIGRTLFFGGMWGLFVFLVPFVIVPSLYIVFTLPSH